jgi:hypothetical protein
MATCLPRLQSTPLAGLLVGHGPVGGQHITHAFLPRGRGKKPRFLPMSARPLSVWPATDLMDRKRQRQPQLLPCLCARAIDWTLGAFCEPKTQTLPWTGRSIDRSSWPAGRGLITDRRPAGRRGSKAQVMDDANATRSATQVISYMLRKEGRYHRDRRSRWGWGPAPSPISLLSYSCDFATLCSRDRSEPPPSVVRSLYY